MQVKNIYSKNSLVVKKVQPFSKKPVGKKKGGGQEMALMVGICWRQKL